MFRYPSRSERREVQLFAAAEKGNFSLENVVLYPAEIKKLEKDGFIVHNIKPFVSHKKLFITNIEWEKPYGQAIPHIVYSYIHSIIETYPKKNVENFAQELYVIAQKAKLKK